MTNAGHLSIGEVLAELRDEFPDVTISKIRFLESQGLIDPERTPSGYRKFYDQDLTRLRWILHQQKEHFLPLKVIKERLDQLGPGEELPIEAAPAGDASEPVVVGPGTEAPKAAAAGASSARARTRAEPVRRSGSEPTRRSGSEPTRRSGTEPAGRTRTPAFVPTLPVDDGGEDGASTSGEQHYSRGELASAAGLEPAQIEQLESFGLVTAAFDIGGEPRFDADALDVARTAAGFFARGLEARHLRMYRNFAEREAVLFGQVLLPYVRQRNPEARAHLQEELVELAVLGRRLRMALLRDAVRETLAE